MPAAAITTNAIATEPLEGDDSPPSVGYREADVDRRDHGESDRIDGRRIEPPEPERRRSLNRAHDDSPSDGCPDRRLLTLGKA
jgi:hypothetical protein